MVSLALYKIKAFLDGGTRLRTACDLKVKGELAVTSPTGFRVPDKESLAKHLQSEIQACKPLFADPPVTEIVTPVVLKKQDEKTK